MKRKPYQKAGIALTCIIICFFQLIPFYMMINMSLKKTTDYKSTISIPHYLYLDNFVKVWEKANLGRAFTNNMIITAGTLFFLILVAGAASYPLSRNKSGLNKVIYSVFVACLIIPSLTLMVPLYMMLIDMKALNTLWGMILVNTAFGTPMCIFLYTGFMNSIPREIDEAGLIDGAGRLTIFFRLIMPLLKPVTASVVILQGVGIWNEYGMALYVLQKKDVQVLTVTLARFIGQHQSQMNWVAAGCMLSSIPVICLFICCQKQFIKGIAASAIKG